MNAIDRAIAYISPSHALERARARRVLAAYEAAKPDRLHKNRRDAGSGNDAVLRAGLSLRQQARHLEQNYDIALGVLNILCNNIVGANGIGVEPQPRRSDGSISNELSRDLLKLWGDWSKRPDVTWQHDRASMERMAVRTWMRDGEVFAQIVEGLSPFIDHGTKVPMSIELLEADYVPMDKASLSPVIQQGIEINAWGRPVAYHIHKSNPSEGGLRSFAIETKRVTADRILHIANRHRIRQLRGVSVFASVLNRFDNLKDYEESEQIAAKVAASMAAYIRKGAPDAYDAGIDGQQEQRQMKFRAGMIFDDLRPGEEIGTIDTNRPNPNLESYRSGQLKAIAAATGPSFSSIAKTYEGSYSSQRQELVEVWGVYRALSSEFVARFCQPVYERFVRMAILSGQITVPADIILDSVDDAIFIPPEMPWIDPLKEVEAFALQEDRAYSSGPEIIRRRGRNPIDMLDQQARWLEEKRRRGLETNQSGSRTNARSADQQQSQ